MLPTLITSKNVKPVRRQIHEISSTSRSRCRQAHRCRGEDRRWHHHSRHGEGKTLPGRGHRRWPRRSRRSRQADPIDIKVGDRVLFGKWSGTEVKIDGEELLIMKESDVMGVIEEGVAKKKAA